MIIIIIINMLLLLIRAPTLAAIEMSADGSCYRGHDIVVGIATTYGLDGLGFETRWVRNFCRPIHTGPEAHCAYCTMYTGSLYQRQSDWGVALPIQPLLASRLSMGRAVPLPRLCACLVWYRMAPPAPPRLTFPVVTFFLHCKKCLGKLDNSVIHHETHFCYYSIYPLRIISSMVPHSKAHTATRKLNTAIITFSFFSITYKTQLTKSPFRRNICSLCRQRNNRWGPADVIKFIRGCEGD